VILAGGRGERLRPLTDSTPKHLLPLAGRPFLGYLFDWLRERGFERVLLLLGYRAEATIRWAGDGARFGLAVRYAVTPPAWQTARRLRQARDLLERHFLLLYCDNYVPLPFLAHWQRFRASGALVQMTVYDNADLYSTSNVALDAQGMVRAYLGRGTGPEEVPAGHTDIGFALFDRAAIDLIPDEDAPFERILYPRLAAMGRLGATVTGHRYYGVGRRERLAASERFFAGQKALLVDRDGVLNRRRGPGEYVRGWADWEWLPDARAGLAAWKAAGYRVLVVTNQAGLARGALSPAALEEIHRRLIEESGGAIERVYVCPHGWDEGCRCRKPAPGLLFQAQRDYDLDLSRTLFLGDDHRDGEAAEAAGCRFAAYAGGPWPLPGESVAKETPTECLNVF